jgi:cyclic beta-1,2-glucan synthetase
MYRVAVESILGVELRGDRLRLAPCIPAHWPGFEVVLRRNSTTWKIVVTNPHGLERGRNVAKMDGQPAAEAGVTLQEDGREHQVEIELQPD